MNLYLVWCPDRGQTKEYAYQYRADSAIYEKLKDKPLWKCGEVKK